MNLAQIQALAAQAAAVAPDMNESVKGGGGARLLPAGYAFGRLVEYVELGHQPQEFNGKAKDPAMEVQLAFALWGEGYQNDDGTPYVQRLFPFAISRNEKARAYLLFKALNWKGTATHFAQLLNEPVLVKIVHEAKSKTDATIVSRIDLKGFLPPLDPVSRQPYNIPAATDDLFRCFLWDFPTKEGWDALYVDGKFDDGQSKNRVQETIMSALNWEGSPIQQLLMQSGIQNLPAAALAAPVAALPASPAPSVPAAVPAAPAAPAVAPAAPLAPVAPAAVAVPASPSVPVLPAVPAIPSVTPAG